MQGRDEVRPGSEPGDRSPAGLEGLQPRYERRLPQLMVIRRNWTIATKLILTLCDVPGCRFEDLVVRVDPVEKDATRRSRDLGPCSRTGRCCRRTSSTPNAEPVGECAWREGEASAPNITETGFWPDEGCAIPATTAPDPQRPARGRMCARCHPCDIGS